MREFKGFPVCKKHGVTYRWRDRKCVHCKKEERFLNTVKREINEVVDGKAVKEKEDGKNRNNNN